MAKQFQELQQQQLQFKRPRPAKELVSEIKDFIREFIKDEGSITLQSID
jgi:hypothetical protein